MLIALGAHQEHVQVQPFQFVTQGQVFPGLLALSLQRLYPILKLGEYVLHAIQVFLGALDALLGVQLAGLEFDDTRRLLENLTAVLRLGGQDLVDTALADQGITVFADAGIVEQVHDVPQSTGRAVDLVFALAAAVHPSGDGYLGEVDGQRVVFVVENQRDLAVGQAAAGFGAIEDDILHLRAAQRLRALLTQHPAHRVGNIALAAAVGAHHAGDAVLKDDFGVVGEGFEAVQYKFLQSQVIVSLRSG